MELNFQDIKKLDKVYRINLINSITGAKPANLIGTKSTNSVENLAVFSSVVHLGSNPPLIGFFIRPQIKKKSDTYQNIIENKYFTINSISKKYIVNAHFTSKKIASNLSEFEICKIQKTYINGFFAPFVKSSKIKIGLSLVETKKIYNNCILVVGKIELLNIDNESIDKEGRVDLESIGTVSISGCDTYNSITKIKKMPYVNSTFNIEDQLKNEEFTI